ncbi:MAG: hypothetical protein ACK56I_26450, partial [bacterium]
MQQEGPKRVIKAQRHSVNVRGDDIVDLELTMFRGIGKNHERSFERNRLLRSSIQIERSSETPLLG